MLFAGTHVADGGRLGWFGIEADGRTAASPRSIRVIAVIPHTFGTSRTAEMTYYETAAGAKVFAAGAFTFAGPQARSFEIRRLLENLWARLTVEDAG